MMIVYMYVLKDVAGVLERCKLIKHKMEKKVKPEIEHAQVYSLVHCCDHFAMVLPTT